MVVQKTLCINHHVESCSSLKTFRYCPKNSLLDYVALSENTTNVRSVNKTELKTIATVEVKCIMSADETIHHSQTLVYIIWNEPYVCLKYTHLYFQLKWMCPLRNRTISFHSGQRNLCILLGFLTFIAFFWFSDWMHRRWKYKSLRKMFAGLIYDAGHKSKR